ncbi:uncharacterized protein LOC142159407 [Mixophyes fleayi]|uniref:uncharacterized protein LOC142159407 n=1 Tax=Mixophyes fleayi TaxID=3061075 RepID=UPI003F4DB43E
MQEMLSQEHPYLSTIRDAQSFINMDPNLLRFPEVVLERIEIKIEEDPSTNTDGEEDQVKEAQEIKSEKEAWVTEDHEDQKKNDIELFHARVYRGRGGRARKHFYGESVHGKLGQTHKSGYSGLSREFERGSGHHRAGRRRRGGWHQFLYKDRQQFERKLKKVDLTYVEEERQRGQRFSEEENEALVSGVLSYYKELCGHSSLKGSASQKRRLWQEVVNKVNSVGTTFRTIEVCKKRYGDCRRAVKQKMAALEHQAMGRGDLQEQIRFNNWEENLREKICSVAVSGMQYVLDTCEPSTLDLGDCSPAETTVRLSSSWMTTIDTSVTQIIQPPASEPVSDGEEATSPLDIQLVSEWSEEEAPCTPAGPVYSERPAAAEPHPPHKTPVPPDISQFTSAQEPLGADQSYLRVQEDYNKSLRHLKRAHNIELHKLRKNVVDGNANIVQHLEGLATEVRELNAHVRQIHMNQAHFNLMFQNYLSDTKQFYGAMVQAMKTLQQPPAISPMVSAASSPVPSPKHPARQTTPNPLLPTAMSEFTALSPAGSAEPASASSTASEVYTSSRHARKPVSAFSSKLLKKY